MQTHFKRPGFPAHNRTTPPILDQFPLLYRDRAMRMRADAQTMHRFAVLNASYGNHAMARTWTDLALSKELEIVELLDRAADEPFIPEPRPAVLALMDRHGLTGGRR